MLTDSKVRIAMPRPKAYKLADANRLFLVVTPRRRQALALELRVRRPKQDNGVRRLSARVGHHVPHRFRAAFSTIMNEWAEQNGDPQDRKVIDLMLAHVSKDEVEGAYNRAAYMPRRRELAVI